MPTATAHVVVAGGGIGALETMLALRELAGDRVRITLIAPEPEFVPRPLLIAAPCGPGIPLRELAADAGAELYPYRLTAVDPGERRAHTSGGASFRYDTLVLAPGARTLPAFDGVITLGDPESGRALAAGAPRSSAFIVVSRTGWPLPAYEAALLSAGRRVLVTPEARPVEAFGAAASKAVARALDAAGIEFIGSHVADVVDGAVRLPGGDARFDRVVATPLLRGPRIAGVPTEGVYALIGVDAHGRVPGLPGVYAVGDATSYPVKHGSITAGQALAVARHIAAGLGAGVTATPFVPELRGMLLTGAEPIVLGGAPAKLPGRYLPAYCGFPATDRAVFPDGTPAARI